MLGRLLDGRYQVFQVLSAGGFGQTYTAKDTRRPGDPTCVVKHLKPASSEPNYLETARRLFNSEAETLEQLGNHDQIPRLLAYFEENQEFYLVQEFIFQSANQALQAVEQLNYSSVPPTILPNTPPLPIAPTQALPVPPARQKAVPSTGFNKLPLLLGGMVVFAGIGIAIAYFHSTTTPPITSPSNEFDTAQFPQSSCGDSPPH